MTDEEKSKIQWTDYTWNPWQGCTKVSPGCDNCYMYQEKKRYGQKPAVVVRSADPTFLKPIKKNRAKEWKWPAGSKVFICSWSDFFHPLADEWREEAWEIIRQRPDLIFQIVTKRTHRMKECLPEDWGDGYENVWLMVSVENREMLPRVEKLLDTPAKVRGVSYEPALEFVDFTEYLERDYDAMWKDEDTRKVCGGEILRDRIDWIICGGESGDNARPFQLGWARQTIRDCKAHDVACFVKQLGATPMSDNEHVFLRHEKGGDPEQWPEDLRVQEYPV